MSLTQKVLALISGIDDPRARIDIMSTINFLFDLYCDGRIGDEDLRSDLNDICSQIISITRPELTEEDVGRRVKVVVDELVKTMRIEGLRRRTIYRFRTSIPI
jgi:hypothetical protein